MGTSYRMMSPLDLLARCAPLAPVRGCEPLVAHQAHDVFALWQAWEEAAGNEQEVPFWATVWPAARVLARWVLDHRELVGGREVLDLGCGAGVVAIAAACAGAAHVVANDVDRAALLVAAENARANAVMIECDAADLLARAPARRTDVALVADLFYERVQAERVMRLLRTLRDRGARVIIADAGRPFAPAAGLTILARERVDVNRDLEGVTERQVTILAMP